MRLTDFFTTINNISPDETRALLNSHSPGSFQLVDVRQPKEYELEHIPGAILVPLGDLPHRLKELDPKQETIVYCRSGVRSRSGSQILNSAGFSHVRNMTGGINGWRGQHAYGEETMGLDLFSSGTHSSAVIMAYDMEKGLGQFYQIVADLAVHDDNKELLEYMARLEDGHMAKLAAKYPGLKEHTPSTGIIEGGFDSASFLERYSNQLKDIESILQTGMMFESQAYDLYHRLAKTETDPDLHEFYLQMASEEQRHLGRLARELEQRLQ